MNYFHHAFCRSSLWGHLLRLHVLPWALEDCSLGSDVLELGPGYGTSTKLLRSRCEHLTCLESDRKLATLLRNRIESTNTTVLCGDGAATQLPDAMFDGTVCFMMLHHVTPAINQDQLFAEVLRVLRPGGVFAGADSPASPLLTALHLFDRVTMLDPAALPKRLEAAGFEDVHVDVNRYAFRFRAWKPTETSRDEIDHIVRRLCGDRQE